MFALLMFIVCQDSTNSISHAEMFTSFSFTKALFTKNKNQAYPTRRQVMQHFFYPLSGGISAFCAASQRALNHTHIKIQNVLFYPSTNKSPINQEQIFFKKLSDIQLKLDTKACEMWLQFSIQHKGKKQLSWKVRSNFNKFSYCCSCSSFKTGMDTKKRKSSLHYFHSFSLYFLCLDTFNKLYLQINYTLLLQCFKCWSIHWRLKAEKFTVTPTPLL